MHIKMRRLHDSPLVSSNSLDYLIEKSSPHGKSSKIVPKYQNSDINL